MFFKFKSVWNVFGNFIKRKKKRFWFSRFGVEFEILNFKNFVVIGLFIIFWVVRSKGIRKNYVKGESLGNVGEEVGVGCMGLERGIVMRILLDWSFWMGGRIGSIGRERDGLVANLMIKVLGIFIW